MIWELEFLKEAKREFDDLDNSVKLQIFKGIKKVQQNPDVSGHGNRLHGKLAGCHKIKFLKLGKRVVYKLIERNGKMLIIVVSARADNEAYIEAEKRIEKYDL